MVLLGLSACRRESQPSEQTQTAAPEKAVVNVYNWTDYVAPGALALFESETGIKIGRAHV